MPCHAPRRSFSRCIPAMVLLLAAAVSARAETLRYDPTHLPAVHGRLQVFTLTPRGDINGFVLDDGTEVKTPPHLSADLAAAVSLGDRVTVHGLKAASLPLVQAMSVGNDATGAVVIDAGPRPVLLPPPAGVASSIATQGRLRMLLHGPRGDVNGALLEDGTVLNLPPPEATRFSAVLLPGKVVAFEGLRHALPAGTIVNLTALGPEGGPLAPVAGAPRPSLQAGSGPPG